MICRRSAIGDGAEKGECCVVQRKERGRVLRDYFVTLELRRSSRVAQRVRTSAGCSKRPFSKAAASEGLRRTLWGTLRV